MKRIILLFSLIVVFCLTASSQTVLYEYVETVNPNTGVRSFDSQIPGEEYITFTNSICYVSDEKGHRRKSFILEYKGKDNNILTFYGIVGNVGGTSMDDIAERSVDLFMYNYHYKKKNSNAGVYVVFQFSEDYQRLNMYFPERPNSLSSSGSNIFVYKRVSKSERSKAPQQLY